MSDIAKFHQKKRTKYNRFIREHGDNVVCKELDLLTETAQVEIKKLLLDWQEIRGGEKSKEAEREFVAIERCLRHAKELNMLAYGTYVNDELVAFTIFEIVHNKTAVLHYGKTNTKFKGLNEHQQHELAKYLTTLDIELMNNEQDLGIEGLRKSKESFGPVDYLKKYTIRPAKS